MISKSTKQAYSEVDEFLDLLTEDERNKVPENIRKILKEEKDKEYIKGINPNIEIKEQNLKEETLAIIAMLNLNYWCEDETEKERLRKVYQENENKYKELMQVEFNEEDIFDKKENNENFNNKQDEKNLIIKNENFIIRIINKLKIGFSKIKYRRKNENR